MSTTVDSKDHKALQEAEPYSEAQRKRGIRARSLLGPGVEDVPLRYEATIAAAVEAERTRIAAWLRQQASVGRTCSLYKIAAEVERGEAKP